MFKLLHLVLFVVYVGGQSGTPSRKPPASPPPLTKTSPDNPEVSNDNNVIDPARKKDMVTLGEAVLILMKKQLACKPCVCRPVRDVSDKPVPSNGNLLTTTQDEIPIYWDDKTKYLVPRGSSNRL